MKVLESLGLDSLTISQVEPFFVSGASSQVNAGGLFETAFCDTSHETGNSHKKGLAIAQNNPTLGVTT